MRPARPWRALQLVALLLAALAGPALAQPGRATTYELSNGRPVVAGEVIVKLRPDARESVRAEVERAEDIHTTTAIGDGRLLLLRSRTRSADTLVKNLARRSDVQYAEPNYLVQIQAVPNDPHFDSLWAMQNTGQVVNNRPGLPGADISATLAWDVTTGSAANVVAVVDTGIDYRHPDLAANVWTASRAFSVTLGGVTVTCPAGTHGFNAITSTCDPMDDNNHGTHCSGIVGAVGNDGFNIVGVNWTASIMGIKFIDAGGHGTTANAINAIEFAIQARQVLGPDANVRVLSNSWVLTGPSQALLDQIHKADLNEMLFVVASGNFGTDNDTTPIYPQSYATPNMISVAATSSADLLWGFSDVGATTVHLGAPGVDIVSTTRNGGYAFQTGTSMAAPHVAGAAALMLAVDGNLTVGELKAGILAGVDPLPVLQGLTVTGGRLNVDTAVRSIVAGPDFRMDLESPASRSVAAGASVTYALAVTGTGGFADLVSMRVTGLPTGAAAVFTPPAIAGTGTSTLEVATSGSTPTGSHLLTIVGESGPRAHSMTVTLVVVRIAALTFHLADSPAGNRILTDVPPTVPGARHADSPALSRSDGNPWRRIGAWPMAGGGTGQLVDVRDLAVWLGLRNSDDQGTAVDLAAELSIDGEVVASGEASCVSGLTRSPARARAVAIDLAPRADHVPLDGILTLTISARIGTGACPGHASARGVRLYYGSVTRDSSFTVDAEL